MHFKMSSAMNSDQSKILLSGNGLTNVYTISARMLLFVFQPLQHNHVFTYSYGPTKEDF